MNDAAKLKETVKKVDYDFSVAGYKTLGVVVKVVIRYIYIYYIYYISNTYKSSTSSLPN